MGKLLVTGANGQLGRAIIHHLLETSKVAPGDIVAASRDTEKLADLAVRGIETRRADFNDEATLPSAFSDIQRVIIISTDELATPGIRLKQHTTAVKAAATAGIEHIVYTSMPNPDRSLVSFAPDHLGTEDAIKASGLPFTILRNAWYFDNYLHSMPHNLASGKWFTSMGTGKVANISRDDCARAAAAALASPPAGNVTLTLTGTESLTAEEIAARFAAATERPLEVVHVSDEQLTQGMVAAGLPEFLAKMLVSAEANIRAGNFDLVTSDFQALTHVEPQTLGHFAETRKAELTA